LRTCRRKKLPSSRRSARRKHETLWLSSRMPTRPCRPWTSCCHRLLKRCAMSSREWATSGAVRDACSSVRERPMCSRSMTTSRTGTCRSVCMRGQCKLDGEQANADSHAAPPIRPSGTSAHFWAPYARLKSAPGPAGNSRSIWHVMASKGESIQIGPAASAKSTPGGSQTRSAFPNSTCARRDAHSV
jgi:hypothetical protein